MRWHCPPDTGIEIRALAVWGWTRYNSVSEAPHNIESLRVSGADTFCFFETWKARVGVGFKPTISDFPNQGCLQDTTDEYKWEYTYFPPPPKKKGHAAGKLIKWTKFDNTVYNRMVGFVGQGNRTEKTCSAGMSCLHRTAECNHSSANMTNGHNCGPMLARRLRRLPNIDLTLGPCVVGRHKVSRIFTCHTASSTHGRTTLSYRLTCYYILSQSLRKCACHGVVLICLPLSNWDK